MRGLQEALGETRLKEIILLSLLITPSGALSPGPLSAGAVIAGTRMGYLGGLLVALGHVAVELPYLAALYVVLEKTSSFVRRVEKPLITLMALFIFYFSADLIATGVSMEAVNKNGIASIIPLDSSLSPFILGVVLTGGNTFFLLWWLSVGLPLIKTIRDAGPVGFAAMYASHVWMDFAWLTLLASIGGLLSSYSLYYAILLVVLGIILSLFAIDMLLRVYAKKKLLPL